MKVLALHLINHDANVTYYDGDKATYLNLERVKGIKKYHYYKWDFVNLAEDLKEMGIPSELDAIVFTAGELIAEAQADSNLDWGFENDQWVREVSASTFELVFDNIPFTADKYYRVEHHYAHYKCAEWFYGKSDKGLVIDGCGDYGVHISVFDGDKRVCAIKGNEMPSIGDLYYFTAAELLNEPAKHVADNSLIDRSGNLMGLISYGKYNHNYAQYLRNLSFEDCVGEAFNKWRYVSIAKIPDENLLYGLHTPALMPDNRTPSQYAHFAESTVWRHSNERNAVKTWMCDWMYTWQTVLSEKIIEFIRRYADEDEKIVYSGGVGHNVVINEQLNNAFPNLGIPPCVGDEGLSLGSLKSYLELTNIEAPECPQTNWQPKHIPEMNRETVLQLMELLCHGKVVAVCQGESHIGPRALGNRSLLYSPNKKYAPHFFNQRKLKNRDFFRPYGIIILESELSKYLHTKTPSPYMLHVAKPTPLGEEMLSGVLHVDHTVRYQTVNDGPYAELLTLMRDSGYPAAVVNTSLNADGKPMVHTAEEAMSFALKYMPDYLVLGNEIYETGIELDDNGLPLM